MDFIPTYDNYRQLLSIVKDTGKLCDYREAESRSLFLVLRHDIEFSIERAMEMSRIETEMGVQSTYFVQVRNNAYNAFSMQNTAMLLDMHRRGHKIGLHYHIGASSESKTVAREIREQCQLLQKMLQIPIDRYSMHRPIPETKYYETELPGLLNAYGSKFFTFAELLDDKTALQVKYISDAKHQWNYGTPDPETLRNAPKVQLLVHPDFWSEKTPGQKENFQSLIREHTLTFIDTIDNECRHFSPYRQEFENTVSSFSGR
ncbi:MAG: hypothetical protein IJK24_07975 [Oscillospiraceae bacterium]|nr:hypothetical protein [Oscillospiraceae bacterium]